MTDATQETTRENEVAFDSEPVDENDATGTSEATGTVAALEAQVAELSDALLRARADYANFKRRTDEEKITHREILMEKFLKEFLPVADNLERALTAAAQTSDYEKLVGGVEAVHRQMVAVLEKAGVKPMDVLHQPFDPNVHQAMGSEPSDEHGEGTVIAELQRGYNIGSRVLRPALVKVAE
ncbi:MAG: nucleotide exchange factor GrpE [Akkermansiaceae bacterium]|nr:nucleotide exchange factor GrpE [Armatimonadota bacterium]